VSERLSLSTSAATLGYDRARVVPGMVHLGVGAFHRAHVAAYIDDVLQFDPSWGVIGASLRKPDTRVALAPQGFLYTHVTRDRSGNQIRVIGSLLDVIDASQHGAALLAAMTDPRIRVVTLTITEKGYAHDPATGQLDLYHPDILHDLAHPDAPVSAVGILARALQLRRAGGIGPFTVLSCDNLPANGAVTARVVLAFAALRDKGLADHIARDVAFPSCMVDRIVPATTDTDKRMVLQQSGLEDAWPVVTEPFSQWVIEDKFCNGRPEFERIGVQMVSDVAPYELMKLRMLNGSHSTLAYLGYLAGHEYVNDTVADPAFRKLIHDLMTQEVMPMLPESLGDLSSYRDQLLQRFANPALKHRTWQIAMDGSQKLPQRLLGTIRLRLAKDLPVTRLALGVAGWMRYVTGLDEKGRAIEVKDPMAARLRGIADIAGRDVAQLVRGLLSVKEIFGDDLQHNAVFSTALARHVISLFEFGAAATVRGVIQG
jgi:fructuronate reductase